MISTDTDGTALSAINSDVYAGVTLEDRFSSAFLDSTNAPTLQIYFCRYISGSWTTRDVTGLVTQMSDIEKRLASQYGVSEGMECTFTFANTPRTTLSQAYTTGTTLNLNTYQDASLNNFDLAAGDWIAISDYDNTEYRRVAAYAADGSTITIGEALDEDYAADETEIRFAWAITANTQDRLDADDHFNGWLLVLAGFEDFTEQIYVFQGKVTGGQLSAQQTVTLTCRDRVKELVDYELTDRVEFDDRGVCTVPKPNSGNTGTGTISDIEYLPGKNPDVIATGAWTLTYSAANDRWDASGYANVTGEKSTGDRPDRRWAVNALDTYGWAVSVEEGDVVFADGDTFKFWSQASGTVCAVDGGDYSASTIDTTNLSYLYPSYIVEYVVRYLLNWDHKRPDKGTSGVLMDSTTLTNVRARAQDYFCELRGTFDAGMRAIDIVDDALKPVLGWIYSTEDDHIAIQYYSPYMLASPTSFTLSHDSEHADRSLNVMGLTSNAMRTEKVRNRIKFHYGTWQESKTHEEEDSNSQTEYGARTLLIRGEDQTDYVLSTRFDVTENVIGAACRRILRRTKDPVRSFGIRCHPNMLLAELGDTPWLYARDVQYSAKRIWVTGLRKNLLTQTVELIAEEATHLNGKFFKWRNSGSDPTGSAIWDSTGFIGNAGEERIFVWSDTSLQLDTLGNANAAYNARLGKPDQWGSYVEDAFIWW